MYGTGFMSTHLTPLTKEFRSQEYVTYLSTRCSETSFKKTNPDFQLAFAPRQFESNRLMWKVIVQLNLIKYVLQFLQKSNAI